MCASSISVDTISASSRGWRILPQIVQLPFQRSPVLDLRMILALTPQVDHVHFAQRIQCFAQMSKREIGRGAVVAVMRKPDSVCNLVA